MNATGSSRLVVTAAGIPVGAPTPQALRRAGAGAPGRARSSTGVPESKKREDDNDDGKRGDDAEDQRAAAQPFHERRQRQLGPLVRHQRLVAPETPLPIRLDACAALRAEDEAYFFKLFQIGQGLSHLAPGQDADASLSDTVIVVGVVAEDLHLSAGSKDEMLVDDEGRGAALARDALDERGVMAVELAVAVRVVGRPADEGERCTGSPSAAYTGWPD